MSFLHYTCNNTECSLKRQRSIRQQKKAVWNDRYFLIFLPPPLCDDPSVSALNVCVCVCVCVWCVCVCVCVCFRLILLPCHTHPPPPQKWHNRKKAYSTQHNNGPFRIGCGQTLGDAVRCCTPRSSSINGINDDDATVGIAGGFFDHHRSLPFLWGKMCQLWGDHQLEKGEIGDFRSSLPSFFSRKTGACKSTRLKCVTLWSVCHDFNLFSFLFRYFR